MSNPSYTTFFEGKSVTSTTADAGADVVFVAPLNHDAEITFFSCTNGGTTDTVNVMVYHFDDDTYYYLLRQHSIAGNDTYLLAEKSSIYLHAGDKLVVFKNGGTFDVSVSGKLFYNPVRSL